MVGVADESSAIAAAYMLAALAQALSVPVELVGGVVVELPWRRTYRAVVVAEKASRRPRTLWRASIFTFAKLVYNFVGHGCRMRDRELGGVSLLLDPYIQGRQPRGLHLSDCLRGRSSSGLHATTTR